MTASTSASKSSFIMTLLSILFDQLFPATDGFRFKFIAVPDHPVLIFQLDVRGPYFSQLARGQLPANAPSAV